MLTQLSLVAYNQELDQRPSRRRVCDLPIEERPLYRLHHSGADALATTELLALLLGTAQALSQGPSGEVNRLYHAPCPNVYNTGGICQGNTPFPLCSPRSIQAALTLFLEGNLFNADLSQGKSRSYPDDVRELWVELDSRKRFPLSELVPAQMTLGHLL